MEYLKLIAVFVAGGGIAKLLSLPFLTKKNKLDYADKAIKFMEDQNEKLIERIELLESKVDKLVLMQCERTDCKIRINPNI